MICSNQVCDCFYKYEIIVIPLDFEINTQYLKLYKFFYNSPFMNYI